MGTRGAYGFRLYGEDKVTYNHYDSYPSGLGVKVLSFARELMAAGITDAIQKVEAIKMVDEDSVPTMQDIIACKEHADTTVGRQEIRNWYCLLHACQGELSSTVQCNRMIDSGEFLYDSLFCEWAYIINLDEMVFEAYQGMNAAKVVDDTVEPEHTEGRYAILPPEKARDDIKRMKKYQRTYIYGGVWLMKSYPLTNLPGELELYNLES